ncbi:MAG: bifunctional UDP-N-acetylmuramoyl-tripeptide:D-alanyl-D-alanine ligase/alanine racemase [Muribaculaceae bacterium]|nr:bifunctional UDP-N-acetylmuramoyl-tripeptide:D-alanyl-D-alanine ligase/alanine racemase [Muribaculaceae bacterium]
MTIERVIEELMSKFGKEFRFYRNGKETDIRELVTDSRNHFNPAESLFFAIKTPGGNDGNKYIPELYQKGVRNFVSEEITEDKRILEDCNFLIVPDSVEALGIVGRLNRNRTREIVAITGSRGKTTLKEILFQLLEPDCKVSRSPRSYNSKIGVPLSLWQISQDSDIALIEAGVSRRGEMKHLSETIGPDIVIFTKVGDAHSHGFASMEEKAMEKSLLAFGPNVKGVVYSLDDQYMRRALEKLPGNVEKMTWSEHDFEADIYITEKTSEGFKYIFKGESEEIETELNESYDLENIVLALGFMLKKGYSPTELKNRIKSLQRINTRLNVSEGINGCSVILDSYTSDISSLLPAIDFMKRRKMPWQRLSLIVSDLHHEGNSQEEAYKDIAKIVRETGISKFIGIGEAIKSFSYLFPKNSVFYKDTAEYLQDFSVSSFNNEIILLKGGAEYGFRKISEQLEARKHETVLEVNLDALLRNYNYFRSHVPSATGIIAMVKASGYGAGSYEIAKTLQDAGAAYLAVAALDEGIDLRRNGIVMPVMIMNPKAANYQSLFHHKLEPVVYSLEMLQTFLKEAGRYDLGEYPVHIKLDTGMHRMGFLPDELDTLLDLLKSSSSIRVASIFSHLATADCLDMDEFTLRQLHRFEEMSGKIIDRLGYPIKRHILNSAGILRFPKYHYDLVRLGIGLYGANTLPSAIEKPLSVVSTLRSVIICIREIEGDEAVGYGRNGKISGKRRIATVPIGYADGMNRKFGNGATRVFLNGNYVPTIGNICMDAMMIDVTGIECKEGDSVEIFGENVSLQSLADTLDTIPYELLTSVSPRVKRIYYRE